MASERELLILDSSLAVLRSPTGISAYDFDFRAFFPCRGLQERHETVTAVARMGAIDSYDRTYTQLLDIGIRLIHTNWQHLRASVLSEWYPLIQEMTPRSRWYSTPPTVAQVERDFCWPVFIKGSRQTSRHQRSLSIARSRDEFATAMAVFQTDPILSWQSVVVREFVPLRKVEDVSPVRIPSSFEFRTFWWQGQCVGSGRYWWEGKRYDWTESERQQGLTVAAQAAAFVNVPFLVVDIAMTAAGHWIVIECNDGQESGYAGVSPLGLWQNIISIERRRITPPAAPDTCSQS